MRRLKLTQNRYALVDDHLFEYLNQYKWCYYKNGYAARQVMKNGLRKTIYMHRFIMQTPDGMDTDHINGDKLDNRQANLQIITHGENMLAYQKLDRRNKSGFRGVSAHQGKWRARIGRNIYLGLYETPEIAAEAIQKFKEEQE